jgi:hypothetical protein
VLGEDDGVRVAPLRQPLTRDAVRDHAVAVGEHCVPRVADQCMAEDEHPAAPAKKDDPEKPAAKPGDTTQKAPEPADDAAGQPQGPSRQRAIDVRNERSAASIAGL